MAAMMQQEKKKPGVDKFIGRDHIHNKVVEAIQGFIRQEKHISEND